VDDAVIHHTQWRIHRPFYTRYAKYGFGPH